MSLTHVNNLGQASMVDVSDKSVTTRQAIATGNIHMSKETLSLVINNQMKKGDVLSVARIAGIQAAKKCSDLIPLCHPLPLSKVSVEFHIDEDNNCIHIDALCKLSGQTGVEMEALTAVSVAALTIYDMCKASDMSMEIGNISLKEKIRGSTRALPKGNNMIQVVFFAALKEQLNCDQITVEKGNSLSVNDIKDKLIESQPTWKQALSKNNIMVAVNQTMAKLSSPINDGDEVAFFPPVTGG